MSTVKEAYNPEKIEQIRKLLESQIRKGLPVQFEIYMDSLKVVPKTNDINEFDSYEDYLNSGTRNIRLLIYDSISGTELVNECVYKMSAYMNQPSNGLSGIDIKDHITEQVNEQVKAKIAENEKERDITQTKQQLKEAQEYIAQLEEQLEDATEKKFYLKNLNLGEIASVVLEGMVRRNPQILSKIPVIGEALSGIVDNDTKEQESKAQQPQEPQSQFDFKEKAEPTPKFSERERMFHALFNELERTFDHDRDGLVKVNFVLNEVLKNPPLIHDIAELLKGESHQSASQNEEENIPDHA